MLYYKDLTDNQVYGYDETEASQLPYIQAAKDSGWEDVTGNWPPAPVPPTYAELRAAEYPSLADQADMQYWDKVNDTNNWQISIAAIKTKYPKE